MPQDISIAGYSYKFSVWNSVISVLLYEAAKNFQRGCWGKQWKKEVKKKNKKIKREPTTEKQEKKRKKGQQRASKELDLNN